MTNPLAAAVEALEKAQAALTAINSEYALGGFCQELIDEAEECVDSILPTLIAALAEAEGSITLPMEWEWDSPSYLAPRLILRVGSLPVGSVFYVPEDRRFAAVLWSHNEYMFCTDLADAKDELLTAVRGEQP